MKAARAPSSLLVRRNRLLQCLHANRLEMRGIVHHSRLPPGFQLADGRVDRASLVVQKPMNRQSLPLLPATYGIFAAIEPGSDFLPGVQPSSRLLANCIRSLRVQRRSFAVGHNPACKTGPKYSCNTGQQWSIAVKPPTTIVVGCRLPSRRVQTPLPIRRGQESR